MKFFNDPVIRTSDYGYTAASSFLVEGYHGPIIYIAIPSPIVAHEYVDEVPTEVSCKKAIFKYVCRWDHYYYRYEFERYEE